VSRRTMRERLLATSMIGGVALVGLSATQAAAQDAAPAPAQGGEVAVQELVVTGSRIPQPNMTSVSPIQTVTSQEVALGGRAATIDILNTLPQVSINAVTDLGPTSNPLSGPGGVATANLRGLGPTRTLVLVDGRRLGIGDPNTGNTNPAPDINQIPSQLIDRVEVLTGGASATYGSDAVAGVVNFVMKRNFEGLQFDAQFGVNQHNQHSKLMKGLLRDADPAVPVPGKRWDGKSVDYSLIFGANAPDGRGNITGYATFHRQDPVTFAARDWAACQLNVDPLARCGGSANSNYFTRADGSSNEFSVLGNAFVPWGTSGTKPPAEFNSNPYEYLIQGNERWTGGFFANYEINEHFKPYTDFSYMHDKTEVVIAPSASFIGDGLGPGGGMLVNCGNPFLSAQQRGAIGCASAADQVELLIGRRNIEGGGRVQSYEHDNYRVVFGAKGKLFGPFNYDLYGSYYYTSLSQRSSNYLSKRRMQDALLVTTNAAGQPVCISGGSCVPWNIFQEGGVTDAATDYLDTAGSNRGTITEQIVEGTITGDLGEYGIKSPWANDALGVALGFQVRRDHLEFNPDEALLSNDLAGAGGASTEIDNSLRSTEYYAEIRAPILQDMQFAHDLNLSLGYRRSEYSTSIKADTYKIGGEWAPTRDIRFRGSFNRAIRAPSILELYTPQAVTNTSQVSEDPCAAGAQNPATLQQCLRTGITPAQYGTIVQCPSDQCAVLNGGNTELAPERANTYTVGFLLTPRFLSNFNASVDWYSITVKGLISNIPLGVTLNNCLTTGDPQYCSGIVRNPTNGILFGSDKAAGGYINGTNANVGKQALKGVDLQANYRLNFDKFGIDEYWGGLTFSLNGTYQYSNKTTPVPGGDTYDCIGLYGNQCQTLNPKWRHNLRVTWNAPHDVQLSAQWRYIGKVKLESLSNEPIIGGDTGPDFNGKVSGESYLDIAANWNINEKLALRAGINNITDNDPPVIRSAISGSGAPNSYPVYDYLGRHMFVALTARF